MNIVVLAGGISTEREISIVSGTQVCKALRSKGHRAILIDVFCGDGRIDQDIEGTFSEEYDVDQAAAYARSFDGKLEELKKRGSFFGPNVIALCQKADTVFMALHGANGEDGKIQAVFELLGIPYTGSSYLGSALAMDKDLTKQLFRENGVPTPRGIVLRKGNPVLSPSENGVGLPCVVKPSRGGSSVGVSIPRSDTAYYKAVEMAFSYEDVLIVEQYISGREFSCGIVDGEAYPVIEIAPLQGFYDYTNKYKAGSTVETCPAEISEELSKKIQKASLDAYHTLHLNSYGRIDVMMDAQENVYCLEANTLPGMTPTSLLPQEAAVLGMDFPALCEKLIEVSLRDNMS
ncbi:MAG TPA: D-alanine--D-alanine ligase [Lachnospiraceae bacterium]|nr:D-alanine--D-alanine ligase [Lachnospiraceae bacterium]